MDGRKRVKTDNSSPEPPQLQLAAVEGFILKLQSCLSINNSETSAVSQRSEPDFKDQLHTLLEQLRGTAAQDVLDQTLSAILQRIQGAVLELQAVIDTYTPPSGYVPPVAGNERYVQDIVACAHKLSYTTFAPLGFVPGQTALRHFKPPAPQDLELRSSQLHQFSRNFEARQLETRQKTSTAALAQQADKTNPPTLPAAAASATDIDQLIQELGLPQMPEGWKPGDPIPGSAIPAVAEAAVEPHAVQHQQPQQQADVQEEEDEADVMPVMQRPKLLSAFNLALNPEYEVVFGGESSDSDDDSKEDSDL